MKRIRLSIIIIMCTILMAHIVNANDKYIVVEEYFSSGGYQSYEFENGRYFENKNGIRRKLEENLQSTKEVLKLSFRPTSKIYDSPSCISGITEDIPYNYYSSIETSSEYIYSLLNNGFSVKSYSASSQVIFMELYKNNITCRILVYENYLKVYLPEGGF